MQISFHNFYIFNISCSKSSGGGWQPTSDPEASINNVSQDRSFHFNISFLQLTFQKHQLQI